MHRSLVYVVHVKIEMAIKVYGTYYSPATNRALVVLHEKDVEFELVSTSVLEREEKKPEYLALQPFGMVPLLQDGDVQIYESRAIARYIADKYEQQGTARLHGATLAERAQVEQWLEVENGTFSVIALTLIKELLYKPAFFKASPDPKLVDEFSAKLSNVLDIYEAHLAHGHQYLAGEFVSIADLAHLPFAWLYFHVLGKEAELLGSRKHVAVWWTAISTRPAWKKVLAIAGPDYDQWIELAKAFKPS